MFQIRWLRRLIRRNTKRLSEDSASTWKQRLSLAYMIIGWNIVGVLAYTCYTGKSDWVDYHGFKTEQEKSLTSGQRFTQLLKIPNATIYRISGFSVNKTEYINPTYSDENQEATIMNDTTKKETISETKIL